MRVYSAVRLVERVVGRGLRGNRLLMGPYNIKREGPIALGGTFAAVSVALAGATLGGIWPGLVLALMAASLILVGTAVAIGYVRGIPKWPPTHVRLQARINQFRRGPVVVSGRGGTPPPTVIAGGKIKVSQ